MMYNFLPESRGFAYAYDPWGKNITLSSQVVLDELSRRVMEKPWVYFQWYAVGKVATVFSWSILAGVGDVFVYPVLKTPFHETNHLSLIHSLMQSTHVIWVFLSWVATVFVWTAFAKNSLPRQFLFMARILSLLMMYFIVLHMIGAPYPRYSIPMRPVIYGLAVVSLVGMWGLFKQRVIKQ